ncbi:MAG: hypothetical protein EXQ63_05285 [Ilumatobacteraceae bacterium]|nr:hypothetical protein [Ilumatobacteraceae bacterium]
MRRFYVLLIAVMFAVVVPFGNQRSTAQSSGAGTITIVSQPFTVTSFLSSEFVVTLPQEASRATTIEISLNRRVASRDSLQSISQGNLALKTIDTVTYLTSALATRGTDIVLPLFLSPGQATTAGLDLKAYGVYPVSIIARDSSAILASTLTFIARVNPTDTSQSLATSLVIADRTPPSLQPDGTIFVAQETRSAVRRLLNSMSSFAAPLAIELQPEILTSLASSTDAEDTALLAELTSALANRSINAQTYVPMDPSSAADNKQRGLFAEQRQRGIDALQTILPSQTTTNKVWIAHEPLTRSAAVLLGTQGIDSIVLLNSAQDSSTKTRATATIAHAQLADGSFFSVRRADPAIADLLDRSADNPVRIGILVAAEVLAARRDLLVDATPVADLALVLATTTGASPDPKTIATLGAALGATPGITFGDLSSSMPPLATTPTVIFSSVLQDKSPNVIPSVLIAQRKSLTTMLVDTDPQVSLWSEYVSAILATTTKARDPYITGLRASMRDLTSAVSRPTRNKFTLGSKDADIRLQLRNKSTSSLTVRVVLSSPKLKFPSDPPVIVLAPKSTTEVVVPTVVRSKGVSTIILRITTPDGKVQLTSPTLLTANVNLLAGLGQPISLALVAALLLWWALSWRSARRAKADPPATTVSTS